MSPQKAHELLASLGAPPHLRRHAQLVWETAIALLDGLERLLPGAIVDLDQELVQAGAILHDAGKILHPEELHRPGHAHEEAGEALLREHGVSQELARICVRHAQWASYTCSREELLVALSDKLWKGKRVEALEESLSQLLATHAGSGFWEVHPVLLDLCESIAAEGDVRLARSSSPS